MTNPDYALGAAAATKAVVAARQVANQQRQVEPRQGDSARGSLGQTPCFTSGSPRDGADQVPVTDIGDIRLDHIHMTITGRRGSRHLTSSQYRTLLALLFRPGFHAMAPAIAWHALDISTLNDPTAMRKCIQRLNGSLRAVSGSVQICWRGSVLTLVRSA